MVSRSTLLSRVLLWGGSGLVVLGTCAYFLAGQPRTPASVARDGSTREPTRLPPKVQRRLPKQIAASESVAKAGVITAAAATVTPASVTGNTGAERTAEMRRAIALEPRSARWSSEGEQFINALVAEDPFRKGRIRDVRCGTTRCGFVVDEIPIAEVGNDPASYERALRTKLHERFKAVRILTSRASDGEFGVQVVGAREGYSLMGRPLQRSKVTQQ